MLSHRAWQYLHDDAESEDAVQMVLMRLWQMVGELRVPMDALAMTLLRNHCIDLLRRRKATTPIDNCQTDGSMPLQETEEEQEERNRRVDMMMELMRQLPAKQQTVLQLRHINGMEMAQIAQLMGMSEVAVRKTLSRARLSLMAQMMQRMNSEDNINNRRR